MSINKTGLANISTILSFLKNNVLNISEVTRQNRLTEILDSFSGKVSEEVYVIQNSKKKDARGILVDEDFFLNLLEYKQIFDQALEEARDEIVIRVATERLQNNKEATISLAQVIQEQELDIDEIERMMDEVEIE